MLDGVYNPLPKTSILFKTKDYYFPFLIYVLTKNLTCPIISSQHVVQTSFSKLTFKLNFLYGRNISYITIIYLFAVWEYEEDI